MFYHLINADISVNQRNGNKILIAACEKSNELWTISLLGMIWIKAMETKTLTTAACKGGFLGSQSRSYIGALISIKTIETKHYLKYNRKWIKGVVQQRFDLVKIISIETKKVIDFHFHSYLLNLFWDVTKQNDFLECSFVCRHMPPVPLVKLQTLWNKYGK